MSAHAEYRSEKRQVDALLSDGYAITGVGEDLDGMHLYLTKLTEAPADAAKDSSAEVLASPATIHTAKLLLQNPEARKYVAAIVIAAQSKDEVS